jgi:hypothetical protein
MSGKEISPSFEPEELGFQLAAPPIPRLHAAFGEGFRYALGPDAEDPEGDLEVYPDAKLIRYSSEGLQVTLRGERVSGDYPEGGVIFEERTEREHRRLCLTRFGEFTLTKTLVPSLNPETPIPPLLPPPSPNPSTSETPPQSETPSSSVEEPAPWERDELPPTQQPDEPANDPSSQTKEQREKQERVALLGRAGRDAQLKRTAKGVDIAKFPLAVHEKREDTDEDVTNWFTVVAFHALAKEISQTVKKGQEYKVIGYRHERIDKDKTIEEIYAATVKPPTKKQQQD